jgi:protein-S-isoprenylcysteine O-methyltransferase Ste14
MAEDTASASSSPGNLQRTALVGLIRLQVVLGLLIFLPAGSLHYWQGWLFWIVFLASVLWITLYFLKYDPHLIAGRIEAGPRAEQRKSQRIIQAFAGLLAATLIVVPAYEYRLHGSSVPTPLVLAADALVAISFWLVFVVFQANTFAAGTVKVEAEQRVISSGPYRFVRHPMYAGGAMGLLATPLALGSFWAVLIALAIVGIIVIRLLDEERYLSANLPGYNAYRREVRYRLIPLLW